MRQTLTLLAILSFAFFTSCSKAPQPSSSSKPTIKIGVILPLSGNMGSFGEGARNGALLAVEEIPQNSKFNYEVVFEDDGLEPKKVALAAQKLVKVDKVDAIISTWSYGGAIVAPLATQNKFIHLAYAWDSKIAQGKYNFLGATPPSALAKKFLEAFKKLNYKKIVVIGVPESGSLFFNDEVERIAPSYGITVTKEVIPWEQKDFRTLINKLDTDKPDVYLVNLVTPHLELLDKQLKDLGIKTPLVAMTGYDVATDLKPFEGRWYVSDSTPNNEFSQKFKNTYHTDKVYGPGQYYETIRLLVTAYESFETKPTTDQVAEKLSTLKDYPSIFGPARFENNIFTYEPVYIKIQNGIRNKISLEEIQ
jgi:branched-chain amino acid transport system substrate-binding protein